ncbi:MAG: PAS domain-containing protein [Anaerolineales bacterium]|nr:PAS domain-containing protein [Anaerolineales bacterium]
MDKNKITLQDYAFFNRLLEGCQIVSRDFRYLFLNEVILEHGKRPWEELLGKTMMEVYPGIENTEMFAKLKEVMETGMPERMLNHFTYPDGSEAWFDLNILPWPDGALILSLDISAQKRLEQIEGTQR